MESITNRWGDTVVRMNSSTTELMEAKGENTEKKGKGYLETM